MATNVATSRTVAGHEVPPAGRWAIDPAHSHVDFIVRHMMISKVRGRFREFSGDICIDEIPERSSVALEAGGFLVGKGVKIEADVEAVLKHDGES
jgi:polyisoprenoid-binding protein YceI